MTRGPISSSQGLTGRGLKGSTHPLVAASHCPGRPTERCEVAGLYLRNWASVRKSLSQKILFQFSLLNERSFRDCKVSDSANHHLQEWRQVDPIVERRGRCSGDCKPLAPRHERRTTDFPKIVQIRARAKMRNIAERGVQKPGVPNVQVAVNNTGRNLILCRFAVNSHSPSMCGNHVTISNPASHQFALRIGVTLPAGTGISQKSAQSFMRRRRLSTISPRR